VRYFAISVLSVASAVGGCAQQPPASQDPPEQPEQPEQPGPELTAKLARDALFKLMRSTDSDKLRVGLDDIVNQELRRDGEWAGWGPFDIYLKERRYSYEIAYGKPPRVCRWSYEGKFKLHDGRWVALPPRVTSMALGSR
jgi:hypothetical protein